MLCYFLSTDSILNAYKSTISIEYCWHIWSGSPAVYLKVFDKIKRSVCNVNDPDLARRLQLLSRRRVLDSFSFLHIFYDNGFDIFFLVPGLHEFKPATRLASGSHRFTIKLATWDLHLYFNSFFSCISHMGTSLPIAFCHNWHLLSSWNPFVYWNILTSIHCSLCTLFHSL